MQYVNPAWLKKYAYALLAFDALLLLVFAAKLIGAPVNLRAFGINTVVVVSSLIHALYVICVYPVLSRRWIWPATMLSVSIFGVGIAASASIGEPAVHFRIIFILFSFFNTMNGTFLPIATIAIAWANFGMQIGLGTEKQPLISLIVLILSTIASVVGWLIFKNKYIDESTKKTTNLNIQLRKEQDITEMLLNSMTDGVLLIDPRGTVTVINDSAALMLGWTKKDAIRLDYRSLILSESEIPQKDPAANRPETAIDMTLKSGTTSQHTSLLKTAQDRTIYVDIVASPIIDVAEDATQPTAGKGVIAILRNVDERKREEQERSEFISTASHEMRTPVASIQGFIELALNTKVAQIDTKARDYLEKAHAATKHLGDLFQDLLTVSKSEDGRLVNNPSIIDVYVLLQELAEQGRFIAEKKGLQLIFDQQSNTDTKTVAPLLYVHADPERLREIMMNLIDNAIKYTPTGMITIGASLKQTSVLLRVSDTGMGIAAEDIPHLFQKFYRTDNSATREIGGTGLGLYICKRIVEQMGGKIWVESTIGAGSTFYVELPRIAPEKVAAITTANSLVIKSQEV